MNIQFIISGWHFNQHTLIDGLDDLNKNNKMINVFYSCHKEPPQKIKDRFEYKIFINEGLGDGAYDQGFEYLKPDNETILFFMHDDVIIKDWSFISICIAQLESNVKKFVGNCFNYPGVLNPDQLVKDWYVNDKAFFKANKDNHPDIENKTIRELIKPESQYLFDGQLQILTVRGSFICTYAGYLREINGFEPMGVKMEERNGHFHIEGYNGYGGLGNLMLLAFAYKINRFYGSTSIGYLSNSYLDSPYMYECARGKIDKQHKMV